MKKIFKIRHAGNIYGEKFIEYTCTNASGKQVLFRVTIYGKGKEIVFDRDVLDVSVALDGSYINYGISRPEDIEDIFKHQHYQKECEVKRYQINDGNFEIYLKPKKGWN